MIIYFKDRFAQENECHIALRDRSFRFGDGMFETLLVANGRVYDLNAHLERLHNGLQTLRITLDTSKIPTICEELIRCNTLTQGIIRIIISRGADEEGASGYLPKSTPYFIIQTFEKPYPPLKGIKLWQASQPTHNIYPFKTNNALPYTLALLEAQEHGCDNAMLCDAHGHLCETASGNLFWFKEDTLYTPASALPMIPGTMRGKVLELWKGKSEKGHFTMDALATADEIFMTNNGVILAAVTEILPLGIKLAVGNKTKELRSLLDKDIARASAA